MTRLQRTFGWWLVGCLSAWSAAADADTVVRRFPGGSGQGAVGIIDASQDTEINGPQALTSGENGELFLLDQVNGRILRFDPKNSGADARTLVLPDDIEPTDLVVRKSEILIWDGSVRALQATGPEETSTRGLQEVSTRAAEDDFTLSAFAQMGSQKPADTTDLLDPNTRAVRREARATSRQHVASRGAGSVVADVIPDKTESSARIEVRQQGETKALAQLQMKVRDRLGAVEFLEIDHQGRMFVLGENVPAFSTGAAAFVARYSRAGALEGIYELPLNNQTPLSRRFVTVSGEGDVYFLRTQRNAVDVLAVGFRTLKNPKQIDVGPPPTPAFTFGKGKGPIAAVRPLNRQQVIETAFAFEAVQWQVTPTAYGRDPDTACTGFNRIRRPGYLHGKANQQVRGIPYCWGCMGSLAQIGARLSRGVLAGNVCTRNDPRTDVTGVDCSAFVSAAWGLATHFTTAAIPAIASPIDNVWDLRPGDALNKPHSHVMLFLRFTPDRKAEVMEASPGSCNGRVCRNVYPVAALLARGYTPVRFRALANEAPQVARAQVATPDKAEAKKPEPKTRTRQR
jgi:hypothetical protein